MAKSKLTFEQALARLEEIVSQIEEGKVSLEESIKKYEEGQSLIKQCREILDCAESKIRILSKGESGKAEETGELEANGETANE